MLFDRLYAITKWIWIILIVSLVLFAGSVHLQSMKYIRPISKRILKRHSRGYDVQIDVISSPIPPVLGEDKVKSLKDTIAVRSASISVAAHHAHFAQSNSKSFVRIICFPVTGERGWCRTFDVIWITGTGGTICTTVSAIAIASRHIADCTDERFQPNSSNLHCSICNIIWVAVHQHNWNETKIYSEGEKYMNIFLYRKVKIVICSSLIWIK